MTLVRSPHSVSMEPQAATSLPAGPQPTSSHPTAQTARETLLPRAVVITAIVLAALLPIILFLSVVVVMLSTNYNFLSWME